MQVRTPRRPFTIATQSKQAPIMHHGPRGAPDTDVSRVMRTPSANKADATLSPSRARTGRPSNRIVHGASPSRRNIQSTWPFGSFFSTIAPYSATPYGIVSSLKSYL